MNPAEHCLLQGPSKSLCSTVRTHVLAAVHGGEVPFGPTLAVNRLQDNAYEHNGSATWQRGPAIRVLSVLSCLTCLPD